MQPVGFAHPLAPVLPRAAYPDLAQETPVTQALAQDIVLRDPRFSDAGAAALRRAAAPHRDIAALRHDRGLVRRTTDELVALAHRGPASFTLFASGQPLVCRESTGHMELSGGRFVLHPGQTLSSQASKDEANGPQYLKHYNVNLTAVQLNGTPVAVRSGRSDTPEKIEENLVFGAAHAPGKAVYSAAIISGMDYSAVKTYLTRLVRGEDESVFLDRQKRSVDSLFAISNTRSYTLGDGRRVAVKKPLLFQMVFSAQARNPINIWLARQRNRPAAIALFDTFARTIQTPQIARRMQGCVSVADKTRFLSMDLPALLGEHPVSRADWLACSALSLIITGRDLDGVRHLQPTGPAHELMLLSQLLKRCGIMPHVQCKSGQDRALTMVSCVTAGALFENLRGELSTPKEMQENKGDMSLLQWLFTQVADTFGAQHIRYARGTNGAVKWGLTSRLALGQPVPQALYLPYNSALGVKPPSSWAPEPNMLARLQSTARNWWTACGQLWGPRRDGYSPLV